MPASQLFAVNNSGRVFSLFTDQSVWKELPYLGVEFKRVTAHEAVIWALGGDHQVYVYVYGSSVPIRVCEEAYENQRWGPVSGFSAHLLPTDRSHFSSADGLTERTLPSIRTPTLAWTWEGPWHLCETHNGQALDQEAWTYAMDFPRTYTAEKLFNSFVRRRRWVRYRRYVALDTWSAVPPVHQDHTQEPFIDISVGGGEVMGEDPDVLMVWGITALGNVLVREGVNGVCPEGYNWIQVATPPSQDVISISVGRSGRVWAVTWDGLAVVRVGITRDCPTGTDWVTVDPPASCPLLQVSVGISAVWAVGRDHRVFFRRGLKSLSPSGGEVDQMGACWLEMVGRLLMVSVGPNDQVWGVNLEDHTVAIRTGVSPTELSGRTWRPICLPIGVESDLGDGLSTSMDVADSRSVSTIDDISERLHRLSSAVSIPDTNGDNSSHVSVGNMDETMSELCRHWSEGNIWIGGDKEEKADEEKEADVLIGKEADVLIGQNIANVSNDTLVSSPKEIETSQQSVYLSCSTPRSNCGDTTIQSINPPPHENNPTSMIGNAIQRLRHQSSSSESSSVFLPIEDGSNFSSAFVQLSHLWLWVNGGGCFVQANNLPKWFLAEIETTVLAEPWRQLIAQNLKCRQQREISPFSGYEEAIDESSWTITGQCRYLAQGQWVPANLELCLVGSRRSQVKDASLSIHYTLGIKRKVELSCCRMLLCNMDVQPPCRAVLSIYSPSSPRTPMSLFFSGESEAEEWLSRIALACNQFRGMTTRPSPYTLWAVKNTGDVFLHDCSVTEEELRAESNAAHQELEVGEGTTPVVLKLDHGFQPGCFISVSGKVNQKADRFHINLQTNEKADADVAFHFNPRFSHKSVVLNNKENGSWGLEETKDLATLSRGKPFEISVVCDDKDLKISIDDKFWYSFSHRISSTAVTHIVIRDDVTVTGVAYNYGAGDRQLREWYWRGIGGHLQKVEGGVGGVTWGISHDCHVYVYTGAVGGGLYRDSGTDRSINVMSDVRPSYVWENQRWNPVTGFTHHGLPTDRQTWSDQTGRHQCTKEDAKLPSRHWNWISDWSVDNHTPGGVDREGWQYATDFPLTFHGHKYVTDLVRRRRWVRRCQVSTSGPWRQMEKIRLRDLSVAPDYAEENTIPLWGVSVLGEVVFRTGVTSTNPDGIEWVLVSAECPFRSICAGSECVWGVSEDGRAHLRLGVGRESPRGTHWLNIDAPGNPLRQVGVGGTCGVWGVDREGMLYHRSHAQPLFPEGTGWELIGGEEEVVSISVSAMGQLWAVLKGEFGQGIIGRRVGVCPLCPVGTGWETTVGIGWSHISARVAFPF